MSVEARQPRASILPWRNPHFTAEGVDEIRKIGEPDVEGDVGDGTRCLAQQLDGAADARLDEEPVGRHARLSLEKAQEMKRAETGGRGKLGEG